VLILSPVQWRTAAMVSTVQRIRHRERDGVVLAAHRQAAELAQESRRERFGFRRKRKGGAIDGNQRHAQLLRQRRQNVAHGDEAHVDQRFADLVAALFLQFERPLQIFLGDQLALIRISPSRMG
jgi:hypothetical protein